MPPPRGTGFLLPTEPIRGYSGHCVTDSLRGKELHIVSLATRPDLIPIVARWGHGYWGHLAPGDTEAARARRLRGHAEIDAVPCTLVVLDDADRAVGSAAILAHDIDGDPRGPWLASVYVEAERRGEGFGAAVVRAIERRAAELGITTLWLFTPDKMAFYEKLGWKAVEARDYRGEHITIMSRTLP